MWVKGPNVAPNRHCFFLHFVFQLILITIANECPVDTIIDILVNNHQKFDIKLKRKRKLMHKLVYAVQKLDKNRGILVLVFLVFHEPVPQGKLMPIAYPFLLNQHHKSLDCSEKRIKHQLSQ